jgi:hypothetical protein
MSTYFVRKTKYCLCNAVLKNTATCKRVAFFYAIFFENRMLEIRYLKHSPNCVLTFTVKPVKLEAVNKTRLTKAYDKGYLESAVPLKCLA